MHKTRPVWFTLVVDDFGIKHIGRQHDKHLIGILKQFYEVEVDWEGSPYCGITLDWNYDEKYIDISMPKYVHINNSCNMLTVHHGKSKTAPTSQI